VLSLATFQCPLGSLGLTADLLQKAKQNANNGDNLIVGSARGGRNESLFQNPLVARRRNERQFKTPCFMGFRSFSWNP
jgi:hypothetical protein